MGHRWFSCNIELRAILFKKFSRKQLQEWMYIAELRIFHIPPQKALFLFFFHIKMFQIFHENAPCQSLGVGHSREKDTRIYIKESYL